MSVGITQSVYRPEGKGWTASNELRLVRLPNRLYQFACYGVVVGAAGVLSLIVMLCAGVK